ncbi:unnamed protein product [Kluyveromyces dobzhanskii CBS 2104]|uniref:WGS project CCBQ000000000 data, contig 00058 n=1 Tax=Kluyveromyces dobzhanskii CBS 2104 TaxID=1427455 RepID=A0A0A8LCX3_9SACH|nr:unnamed protein product [Kluyveromyces dobzhanskii CBS 2104]
MLRPILRCYSSSTSKASRTLFQWFPKTFVSGKPQWEVDLKKLRKEYRQLQAEHHPDVITSNVGDVSSELNRAYKTLSKPLTRSQYILGLQGIDLNQDGEAQKVMSKDPQLLMLVLDVHEQLEDVNSEEDLKLIDQENKQRLKECEQKLEKAHESQDWETAAMLTVELRYWSNLDNAIKEWEPGKPILLTH